ncbi:MAG: maleylpyruvate isomerase family mycothiol-dependent enzyme [Actinomycetota bacterium]|nr:maleylpyruvate isomerase family mycothiol-dependent enzyme [Actinomycetota bacterium]
MTGGLPFESYVDAIGEEAERILQIASRGADRPVPGCPGWGVSDVVRHVALLCSHWEAQVAAADPESMTGPLDAPAPLRGARLPSAGRRPELAESVPSGTLGEAAAELDHSAAALVTALGRAGPLAPCWNWSGSDLVAAWAARRVAVELALHRVDCEQALGEATPIETELAVDGVDERLDVHLRASLGRVPGGVLKGSICLVASDSDASWLVESSRGQIRWRRARGPADVVLVATASELLQFVWNRLGADELARTGRLEVALSWRAVPA